MGAASAQRSLAKRNDANDFGQTFLIKMTLARFKPGILFLINICMPVFSNHFEKTG
jgi:hypothetical protein